MKRIVILFLLLIMSPVAAFVGGAFFPTDSLQAGICILVACLSLIILTVLLLKWSIDDNKTKSP